MYTALPYFPKAPPTVAECSCQQCSTLREDLKLHQLQDYSQNSLLRSATQVALTYITVTQDQFNNFVCQASRQVCCEVPIFITTINRHLHVHVTCVYSTTSIGGVRTFWRHPEGHQPGEAACIKSPRCWKPTEDHWHSCSTARCREVRLCHPLILCEAHPAHCQPSPTFSWYSLTS